MRVKRSVGWMKQVANATRIWCLVLVGVTAHGSVVIDSERTFDIDMDGWVSSAQSGSTPHVNVSRVPSSGNPGGYIRIEFAYAASPVALNPDILNNSSPYIGNWGAATLNSFSGFGYEGVAGRLEFDFIAFSVAPASTPAIRIVGDNGAVLEQSFSYEPGQVGSWAHVGLSLQSNAWTHVAGNGHFGAVLSAVAAVYIRIEGDVGVGGTQTFGFDNWAVTTLAGTLVVGGNGGTGGSTGLLPFADGFDSYPIGAGMHGVNTWTALNSTAPASANYLAFVTNAPVAGGAHALAMTDVHVRQRGDSSATAGWYQIHVQPVQYRATPNLPFDAGFAFYVSTGNVVNAFDGQSVVPLGTPSVYSNVYSTFTVFADYTAKKWDLYHNATRIGTNLSFYSNNDATYAALNLWSIGTTSYGYLDDVIMNRYSPLAPTVSLSASGNGKAEEAGSVTVTGVLNFAAANACSVQLVVAGGTAIAGSDYINIFPATLSFAPGQTNATVTITIVNDTAFETPDETLELKLTNAVNAIIGGQAQTTIVINDEFDIPPTISVTTGSTTQTEETPSKVVTIMLDKPCQTEVLFTILKTGTATLNGDYTLTGNPVIAVGQVSASFELQIVNDQLAEADETVSLALSGVQNAIPSGAQGFTMTIDDTFDRGQANIATGQRFAWSENTGWINFAPTHGGGATVVSAGANGYLSGYAWSENLGWIKLGDGTGPYANNSATDWGVNMDAAGNLSGYAWSENAGWINVDTTHGQVVIATTPGQANTGNINGYAWGENVGWVHFRNASSTYGVRTTVFGAAEDGSVFRFR